MVGTQRKIYTGYDVLPRSKLLGQTLHAHTDLRTENVESFMQDFWDGEFGIDVETGRIIENHGELNLHMPGVGGDFVSAANDHDFTSAPMQQSQARNRAERWKSESRKNNSSMFGHGYNDYGDHAKPSAGFENSIDVMLGRKSISPSSIAPENGSGFMDYVDAVNDARDSTIDMLNHMAYHPIDTIAAPFVGAYNVARHPVLSYQNAVHGMTDFMEGFANGSGADRFGMVAGIVGNGAYGGAAFAGAGFGLGRAYSTYGSTWQSPIHFDVSGLGSTLHSGVDLSRVKFRSPVVKHQPGQEYHHVLNSIGGSITEEINAITNFKYLEEDLAKSFAGGRYAHVVTDKPLSLYRVWSPGQSREFGGFWSIERPVGSFQSRIDSALLPEWGKLKLFGLNQFRQQATHYTKIILPSDSPILAGAIGYQRAPWVGTASQIMPLDRVTESMKVSGGLLW